MQQKRKNQDLYVFMNGKRVGKLIKDSSGNLIFTYDSDWLNDKLARPLSLSLPLSEEPHKGALVEAYFDNLLPDSELIRKRIQARFSIPTNHCYDLLSYIGADCVGALQLLTQDKISSIQKIQADPINDLDIAKILKNYKSAPLGMDQKIDFRISIAGAQEKTALLWHKEQWHLPRNVTPTSHIIKLPIGHIKHANIDLSESVENEWLCLKILSAYKLPVNQAFIHNFSDVKTLVVERFDREWSNDKKWLMRLPQEDFCQALGVSSALKYESDGGPGIEKIMNILLGSKEALKNRIQFMKSVFLFWIIGALDGHAKNFSISIGPGGTFQLTPLYDVLSAYPIAAKRQLEWKDLKMAMSLKSKNRHYHWYNNIQPRHWLAMASHCKFSENIMQAIINEVFDRMENVIEEVASQLPKNFPNYIYEPIFSEMRKIKKRFQKN